MPEKLIQFLQKEDAKRTKASTSKMEWQSSWARISVRALGSPVPWLPCAWVEALGFWKTVDKELSAVPWWEGHNTGCLHAENAETYPCPRRGPHFAARGRGRASTHSSHHNKDMLWLHPVNSGWADESAQQGPPTSSHCFNVFVTLMSRMNLRLVLFLAKAVFLAYSEEVSFLLMQASD